MKKNLLYCGNLLEHKVKYNIFLNSKFGKKIIVLKESFVDVVGPFLFTNGKKMLEKNVYFIF